MTSQPPPRSRALVDAFTPDVAERMNAPMPPPPEAMQARPGVTRTFERLKVQLVRPSPGSGGARQKTVSGSKTMAKHKKIGPLKRLERYVMAIFKLGRTEYTAKDASRRIGRGELRMDDIESDLGQIRNDLRDIWRTSEEVGRTLADVGDLRQILEGENALVAQHERLSQRLDQHHALTDSLVHEFRSERAHLHATLRSETALLARIFADLSRRVDRLAPVGAARADRPEPQPAPADLPASEGFDLFKDSFYHRLENRFRGSVEDIADRLRVYLPDVEAAVLRTGGKPVMDLGCGRGEWLGLLKRAGLQGFGIDTNAVQIEAAREQGLDVRLGDAMQALADQPDESVALISAHHLVEHLPFDAVAWIAREAERVLAPGGVLMVETPHVRNVLVGATTFHTDPTHLKPMTEQVLTVLFETAGFDPVEARALNPHARFSEFLAAPDFNDELAFLLFGPQDLAVLGTKPAQDED